MQSFRLASVSGCLHPRLSKKQARVKICMFVKNSFKFDARVAKEAQSLVDAGHEVTVIALHGPGVAPEPEVTASGVRVIRVRAAFKGIDSFAGRVTRGAQNALRLEAHAKGTSVDQAELDRVARFGEQMTATPGGDTVRSNVGRGRVEPEGGTGLTSRIRARAVLAMAVVLTGGLRLAVRLARTPGRAVKGVVENRRMLRVGRSERADVFHAHDRNTLWVALKSALVDGVHVVYDSHEYASARSRVGRLGRGWASFTERRWLRRVDGLIVASPIWLEMLKDRYRQLPRLAVAVINTPPTRQPVAINLHRETGLAEGMPLLVYQGTIQEHRGLEAAVAAVARLDDIGLVIIGWGYHRPSIERLVERLGVRDRVRFLGPVPIDDLLDYTAGGTIGLCNIVGASLSYRTALPNKLFEYFMAGLPVIGSEGMEISSVIDETMAGVLVPPEDPDAIVVATTAILANYTEYSSAALVATSRYRWEAEESKLLEFYGDLDESDHRAP